jgi:phage recombination protein Bet
MTNEIVKTNGKADDKVAKYTDKQVQLIHDTYAKNTTKEEFELFMYTAGKYGLDPLLKQIWCVKFKDSPAQIYAGRDGFLEIAHTRANNQFNGFESGMKDTKTAYAKVYRKDMEHPFYVEVDMAEYSTNMALWKTKPNTMLKKVAESQCLRKAFSVSGIYSPEEMSQWECDAQGIEFNKVQPKAITETETENNDFDWSKLDLNAKPKVKLSADKKPITPPIIKRLFAIQKKYGISADDYKMLCMRVTKKEHSSQWTYGDIKKIEEELNKVHDENNKEVEDTIDGQTTDFNDKEFDDIEEATTEELEKEFGMK